MEVMTVDDTPPLFNGPVETGMRSLLLLEAFHPVALDLDRLSLLDYFVVHTADIDGPNSLHPALSSNVGEYRIRRRVIEDGITLMRHASLVDVIEDERGVQFVSGDDAPAFIKLLATDYNLQLMARAEWLAEQAKTAGDDFLASLRASIERWTMEFQLDEGQPGGAT